jgi:penicillin-binding protein 2
MVGRIRSQNFIQLSQDTLKPLFNRALMAQYPPGSTFKLINGMIGLQEQVLRPWMEYYCDLGYHVGNFTVGCHNHDSPLDLVGAVQNSCNAYFCNVFRTIIDNPEYGSVRESLNAWTNYLRSFGFGEKLHTDFANELRGLIPSDTLYDAKYGTGRWHSLMLISLIDSGQAIDPRFREKHVTGIDSIYFIPIINGMDLAINGEPGSGSTARSAFLQGITICGKTGTAENPHGEDHSIFVAFAPKENPQIALAVYVENGGFGSTYAAPLASLLIEDYLTDTITRPWVEDRIIHTDLIHFEKDSEHMD